MNPKHDPQKYCRKIVATLPSLALALLLTIFVCGCGSGTAPPAAPKPSWLPPAGTQTQTSLKIGDKFPVLNTVDLDGNEVVLGPDMLGERATLIVFWSTWCEFCMTELPHEIELSEQYADSGLRVIGVNADDTPEIARDAAREYGIPWLNVYEGPDRTISEELDISFWPTLYLLDADGTIISSTRSLRGIGAETLPDGTARQVNMLDRTLEEVLSTPGD